MPIPLPLTVSDWRYKTATGGGLTVMYAAVSGGVVTLTDPQGNDHRFRYGTVGGGLGGNARLPRLGKFDLQLLVKKVDVDAVMATEDLPSWGRVLMGDAVAARGLQRDDFMGPCVFVEGGAGLVAGGSGSAIFFGVNPLLLGSTGVNIASHANLLFPHDFWLRLLRSSKGVIIAAGINGGLQGGASVTGTFGCLF